MPEDADANEGESVVRREFEAYAYSSDLIPHHSIHPRSPHTFCSFRGSNS